MIGAISEDLIRLVWLVEDANNKYNGIVMSQAFFPRKRLNYSIFENFLKYRFSELRRTKLMTLWFRIWREVCIRIKAN